MRKKQPPGFLTLPGEIRNEIYSYCFENTYIDLTPNSRHILQFKRKSVNKQPKPPRVRVKHKLGHYNLVAGLKTNWAKSYSGHGLSLTCKQINWEVRELYYSTPTFIVSSINRLNTFLDVVPADKLALIKKFHISHAIYGTPELTEHMEFKRRHDNSWLRVMHLAAERLTGLELLTIRLVPNDTPLIFDLSQTWVQPLLAFASACATNPAAATTTGESSAVARKKPLEVQIMLQFSMLRSSANVNPIIQEAWLHLRKSFVDSIYQRLKGKSLEDAMASYNSAKSEKYKSLWSLGLQHHPLRRVYVGRSYLRRILYLGPSGKQLIIMSERDVERPIAAWELLGWVSPAATFVRPPTRFGPEMYACSVLPFLDNDGALVEYWRNPVV